LLRQSSSNKMLERKFGAEAGSQEGASHQLRLAGRKFFNTENKITNKKHLKNIF